jgi:hypothetical protein
MRLDEIIVPIVSPTLYFFRCSGFCCLALKTKLLFLMQVDYEFEATHGLLKRICRTDEKFSSNLSILLSWSPFGTESELQNQVLH